jgi:hypothetical protein
VTTATTKLTIATTENTSDCAKGVHFVNVNLFYWEALFVRINYRPDLDGKRFHLKDVCWVSRKVLTAISWFEVMFVWLPIEMK